MAAPAQVAVVGAGAFGRNHLRVFRELSLSGEPVNLAAVVDSDPQNRSAAAETYAIPAFDSVDSLLAANLPLDAASICVPTVHHAASAAPLLEAGLDLLIEKPFAATLAEADALILLAEKHGCLIQVGHLERFNPAVTAARAHLKRPMFFEAHRLSVFTPRSLDVDVVLDLMIHDLDIVLSFVESQVVEVRAVGLPVLSNTVDIANVRVAFANGCVANFTASRVSTERVRKLRFFQPRQYLSLDFARQDLLMIDVDRAGGESGASTITQEVNPSQPSVPRTDHPSTGLKIQQVSLTPVEPLRLEIESFLHAARSREKPIVDAPAGRHALALALEINSVIAEHAAQILPLSQA